MTASGRVLTIPLSEGAPVTGADVSDGLARLIPSAELEQLVLGSTLRIEMRVSFNPGSCHAEHEAVRFPEGAHVLAMYRDLTTFEDNTFNGWEAGPAAPSNLNYFKTDGSGTGHYLYAGTPSPAVAGVLLSKAFGDLEPGALYAFRLLFKSTNTYTNTRLYLVAVDAGGRIADAPAITQQWQTLDGSFIASPSTVLLQIGNDSPDSVGNDYLIDDIEVVYAAECD